VDLIFPAPSTRHPSGGVAMIYELACCMARRGHLVHLFHVDYFQANVTGLDDIDWFNFPEVGDLIHHFPSPGAIDPGTIPAADVIFGFSTEEQMPEHTGLPVVLIQGHKMLGEAEELHAFTAPCPKVCVARWLVEVGRELGVPARQLVHVPLGLRHEKYRLTRPIDGRPPRASFCYSAHPQKGAQLAIEVLERVKQTLPELEVVVFGVVPPEHAVPDWMRYWTSPSQSDLVDAIYNTSRVFLCTSEVEGFGLSNIEAMAGGAALVTTDNGGSRDYALHDRTALVAPTGDVDALTRHVVSLLRDDDERVRLATAGRAYVERFDWDRSALLLETFLEDYLADPVAYGRPLDPPRAAGRPGASRAR
jgi:glycosyltransferase involved in cell wall biosynthesis